MIYFMGKMMITTGIWGAALLKPDQIASYGRIGPDRRESQGKKLVDINKAGLDLEKSTSAG